MLGAVALRKKVYPRVCGGTFIDKLHRSRRDGLSPRVRGNPAWAVRVGAGLWSIPACAGEPGRISMSFRQSKVYPRVCGGTYPTMTNWMEWRGLSPRVRGNLRRGLREPGRTGSIPACAGEPVSMKAGLGGRRVYPRVCGGTRSVHAVDAARKGLSPRVRGNLLCGRYVTASPRSIPACAGEPPRTITRAPNPAVYPRVCGGTLGVVDGCGRCGGLSPRVRGNPARWRRDA